MSIKYTERLAEAGIEPSVGSVGDSYDNALAETINGLYKAEVIHRRGPWRSFEAVELATRTGDAAWTGKIELNRSELHLKRRRFDAALLVVPHRPHLELARLHGPPGRGVPDRQLPECGAGCELRAAAESAELEGNAAVRSRSI